MEGSKSEVATVVALMAEKKLWRYIHTPDKNCKSILSLSVFSQVIIGGIVSLLFLVATVVTTALIVMNHHYSAQGVSGVPPA